MAEKEAVGAKTKSNKTPFSMLDHIICNIIRLYPSKLRMVVAVNAIILTTIIFNISST